MSPVFSETELQVLSGETETFRREGSSRDGAVHPAKPHQGKGLELQSGEEGLRELRGL